MRLSRFTGAAQVIFPYTQLPPPTTQKKYIQVVHMHVQPTMKGDLKDSVEMKTITNKLTNVFGRTEIRRHPVREKFLFY
jgi:hypothetical protein